jgi:SAM-dependent methyltransferase
MIKQRLDEWLHPDPNEVKEYFLKQWTHPYRSTEMFCEWLDNFGILDTVGCAKNICDIGCGAGANTYYLANYYPNLCLTGIDISPYLIKLAKKEQSEWEKVNKHTFNKIRYRVGDIYNLSPKLKNNFYGIIMFQVLSWLPEYEKALTQISKLNPEWISFSCLMNDSLVECEIKTKDYSRISKGKHQEKFYNVYSIPKVKQHLNSLGYKKVSYTPFEIDIDIPKDPENQGMGTYTQKLDNNDHSYTGGDRIQISGGLLLNWYFVLARK